jgi:hypothetical protein
MQIGGFFTKQISNDIFIFDKNTGVNYISIILVSGTGTIKGTEKANGLDSDPIPMIVGVPINLSRTQPFPNGSLTIDFTAGTVLMMGM